MTDRRLPFPGFVDRARRTLRSVGEVDPIDLAIPMTLLVVLLHSTEIPEQLVRVMAVAGLVYRPLARSPWFWLAVVWVRLVFQLPNAWWSIDNHQYLITWWCLALGLGLLARDVTATLELSARWLIGLCFAFATFWKLYSPDFIDGTFLHWTILRDARFGPVAEAVLGLPGDAQDSNRAALRDLQRDGSPTSEPLTSGARIRLASLLMAWWTVAIEAAVAISFLWRGNGGPARWRGIALLAFIVTIYPIAPVVGFAWVLIAVGVIAIGRGRRGGLRIALVATFTLAPAFSAVDHLLVWMR